MLAAAHQTILQPTDGCGLSLKNNSHCPLRALPDMQKSSCSFPCWPFVGAPRLTEFNLGPQYGVPGLSGLPLASLPSHLPPLKSLLNNRPQFPMSGLGTGIPHCLKEPFPYSPSKKSVFLHITFQHCSLPWAPPHTHPS